MSCQVLKIRRGPLTWTALFRHVPVISVLALVFVIKFEGITMLQRSKNIDKLKLLRTFAMGVMAAGAILSVYLTLQSFYSNQSVFLLILSVLWVLSPFAALLGLDKLAMQWSFKSRIFCCLLMVIITVFSLLTYTRSFGFPGIRDPVMLWATPLFSLIILCMGYFLLKSSKSTDIWWAYSMLIECC